MRWLFLIACVICGGCNFPLGSSTTGSDSTPDAAITCPETSGCQTCTQCALNGPCSSLYQACLADSSCQAIDQCVGTNCAPGDASCRQLCESENSAGTSDYEAITNCVDCEQCTTACGLCSN